MSSSDIEITRIQRCFYENEGSDILATFDASIGDDALTAAAVEAYKETNRAGR